MEILKNILSESISLFTIMNPIAAGAIMLSLCHEGATKHEIRAVAIGSARSVFVSMVIIFLAGVYIFQFFGVSPDGLRIFGGVILLTMGYNMVQGHGKRVNHLPKEHEAAKQREDISVVPLAIPIIVGPGLATRLITMRIGASEWPDYVAGIAAIVVASIATLVILIRMPYIRKRLGENGLKVLNRLMGLIVGALAVQMMITGILGLLNR